MLPGFAFDLWPAAITESVAAITGNAGTVRTPRCCHLSPKVKAFASSATIRTRIATAPDLYVVGWENRCSAHDDRVDHL